MERTMMAAMAIGGCLLSGGLAKAEDWSGSAAVASLRGYTASPGLQMPSNDAGLASASMPGTESATRSVTGLGRGSPLTGVVADGPGGSRVLPDTLARAKSRHHLLRRRARLA